MREEAAVAQVLEQEIDPVGCNRSRNVAQHGQCMSTRSVIGHEIIDDLAQQFSQHLLMATEICQNVLHRNIIFFTYIPFPISIAPILDVYKHGHCALSAKSSSVYPAMIDDISRLYQAIAIKKIEYLRSVIITRV